MKTKNQDWLKYADFDSIDLSELSPEEKRLINRAKKAGDDSVYYDLNEGGYVFAVILSNPNGTTNLVQFDCNGYIISEGDQAGIRFEDGNTVDYRWLVTDNGLMIVGLYTPKEGDPTVEVLRRGFSESKLTEDIRLERMSAKEFTKRVNKKG